MSEASLLGAAYRKTRGDMTKIGKASAGILIAVAVVVIAAMGLHDSSVANPQRRADTPLLKLEQNLLLQDQQVSLEDGDATTRKATAMKNFDIALAVTAPQLAADYEANEVAADKKYKIGKILVSGAVSSIKKDFTGDPYVVLTGDQLFQDVQVHFSDADTDTLGSLKKGQQVYFVCEARERIVTEVMLGNCATVESYTAGARQGSDQYVEDILSGRREIDKSTADLIRSSYVIAQILPQQSRCFTQADQECAAEIKDMIQRVGKPEKQQLEQRAKAFVGALKVK